MRRVRSHAREIALCERPHGTLYNLDRGSEKVLLSYWRELYGIRYMQLPHVRQ